MRQEAQDLQVFLVHSSTDWDFLDAFLEKSQVCWVFVAIQ